MRSVRDVFIRFLPFWLFLIFFKFGGNIQYTVLPALGERILPVALVGLLIGGESFFQLLFDVPAGYLLDRFGYLRCMKIGSIFFIIAALCIASGLTVTTFLLTVFVSVFGWLFFSPGVNAYILSHARRGESGRFFSIRDSSNAVGVILGVGGLPFVLLLPVPAIGAIAAMLFLISLAFLYLSPPDAPHNPEPEPHHVRHYFVRRQTFRNLRAAMKRLNPASTMLLFYNVGGAFFYATIWFVVPLIIESQVHSGLLGLGLAVFDVSILLLGYALGSLADRRDKRVLVFFGLLIFAVCGMLVATDFGWLFIFFGFLAAFGDEMAGVSLWAWLHGLDREHAGDGAVAGVLTLADDLGWTLGPMFAGLLFALLGPTWTIVLSAVPIFCIWLGYYAFVHKHFPYEVVYELWPRPNERRHK